MSTLEEWLQEVQEAMRNKIGKELNDILYKEFCAGRYHVSGYTRDDGTKVSDCWRNCGASHNGMNPNYGKITGAVSEIKKNEPALAEKYGNVIPLVGYGLSPLQERMIDFNYKKNHSYKDAKDCMNISIIGPENVINNSEFKILDDSNAKILGSNIGVNLDNGLKTVQFDKNSSLAKNVNNSEELKEQLSQNIDTLQKGEPLQVSFNQDSNLFRSLHNATVVNVKIEGDIIKGYLYDFYDFEYSYNYYNYNDYESYKDNFKLVLVNNSATFLQTIGQLKNYHIIIPIEVKLKKK